MKIRTHGFNIYLAALLCGLLFGCETAGGSKKGKEASTFRVFLESRREIAEKTETVSVYRNDPLKVMIIKDSVLDESHVKKAEIVDTPNGWVMNVQLNQEGALLLQGLSLSERGKRIVIFSFFTEARFLGAPILSRNIADGRLVFEPDASRQEAERIARGLNNLVREINNQSAFK